MTTNMQDFIDKIQPIALDIEAETGIKPTLLITQAAHESRWGQSDLTVKANNLFGMTGDTWQKEGKPVVVMRTTEHSPYPPNKIRYWTTSGDVLDKTPDGKGGSHLTVLRPFRAYASWDESARDWADLMKTPRFSAALNWAKSGNIEKFALALTAAKYATDLNYEAKLVSVFTRVEALV